jgi:hypothetical protein
MPLQSPSCSVFCLYPKFHQLSTETSPKLHHLLLVSDFLDGYSPGVTTRKGQTVKERKQTTETDPVATAEQPLSPHWAFVVQFQSGIDMAQGDCAGRVEHMVSGQSTHFCSWEDLRVFITQVLADLQM